MDCQIYSWWRRYWTSPNCCWRFELLKKLCFGHALSKLIFYLSFTHLRCYIKILELDFGLWILDIWISDFWNFGIWNLEFGFWNLDFGFEILNLGFLNQWEFFGQWWIDGFWGFELLISFCKFFIHFYFCDRWNA